MNKFMCNAITIVVVVISMIFAGTMSALATTENNFRAELATPDTIVEHKWPVTADEMCKAYYDMNKDGKISVADLALVKRESLIGDSLSYKDYEMVNNFLLTGNWPYELEFVDADLDELKYDDMTKALVDEYSYGILVDIQVFDETVTIRHLNDGTVYELRLGKKEPALVKPIAWAYNLGNYHIGIEVSEENDIYWESYEEDVKANIDGYANIRMWPTFEKEMYIYYDFDRDDVLTAFDLVMAKKYVFYGDSLGLLDVTNLQKFLLTGEWESPLSFFETDTEELEYNKTNLNLITTLTYGEFVDFAIEGDTARLRFLNSACINEVRFKNDEIVLKIKDFNFNGTQFCIGVTAENTLAWNWSSEDSIAELN